jgi:hypothetical protein
VFSVEVISKLAKVGRFLRNRRLRTDGSESHPYLEFVNFEIGSVLNLEFADFAVVSK